MMIPNRSSILMIIALSVVSIKGIAMSLSLQSPDFTQNTLIPKQYTCEGGDQSPTLKWNTPPAGTKSYALIVDDPDAPTEIWVHWVLFNIPANVKELKAELPSGTISSKNSWGSNGYRGPCPPSGTHRYFFKIYALDTVLSLTASANSQEVFQAMQGHILEESDLIGLYKKQS